MKYLLIKNPGSRSGNGRKLWNIWESELTKADVDYSSVCTNGLGHAFSLAKETNSEVVVAVGGDGTINEVIDGVMQSNKKKKMGVLYSGTSPDFCKFHKIPIKPDMAVNALLADISADVDVARITYVDFLGHKRVAHFGCSCNIGMGASIARLSNKLRSYFGDTFGTGLSAIITILRNRNVDLNLIINGEDFYIEKVNNFTIAKNPFIASGLKLNVDLSKDDGKLSVFAMYNRNILEILFLLPKFYNGSVTKSKDIFYNECTEIIIESSETQEIEFDGDPRGFLPAKIELLPKALTLVGGSNE